MNKGPGKALLGLQWQNFESDIYVRAAKIVGYGQKYGKSGAGIPELFSPRCQTAQSVVAPSACLAWPEQIVEWPDLLKIYVAAILKVLQTDRSEEEA